MKGDYDFYMNIYMLHISFHFSTAQSNSAYVFMYVEETDENPVSRDDPNCL